MAIQLIDRCACWRFLTKGLMLVSLLLPGVGWAQSSDACVDVSGIWNSVEYMKGECEHGTQYRRLEIQQTGCAIQWVGTEVTGEVNGSQITWNDPLPDRHGRGWYTLEEGTLTVSGSQVEGTLVWEWSDDIKYCMGETQFQATRHVPESRAISASETVTGPWERDYWPTAGWRTNTLEAQGVDPKPIAKIVEQIPTQLPFLSSLLIVRQGELVWEQYFPGKYQPAPQPEQLQHVYSVTKSVTSALVGLAMQRQQLHDVDQTLEDLLPQVYLESGLEADKRKIRLQDLLQMTSGFKWIENFTDPTGVSTKWAFANDWTQAALALPLENNPGSRFNYNSANSHLLGVIVSEATGMPLVAFAKEALFAPLGITNYYWSREGQTSFLTVSNNKGQYDHGGGGLELTARDLAKFGYLYLNQGVWEGRQLLAKDWVDESFHNTVKTGDPSTYGYQWWTYDGWKSPFYYGVGLGGQLLFVVPKQDLVIVMTSHRPATPSPVIDLTYYYNFQALMDALP